MRDPLTVGRDDPKANVVCVLIVYMVVPSYRLSLTLGIRLCQSSGCRCCIRTRGTAARLISAGDPRLGHAEHRTAFLASSHSHLSRYVFLGPLSSIVKSTTRAGTGPASMPCAPAACAAPGLRSCWSACRCDRSSTRCARTGCGDRACSHRPHGIARATAHRAQPPDQRCVAR